MPDLAIPEEEKYMPSAGDFSCMKIPSAFKEKLE